ncbi:MAG: trypsin-like peptidase domain-containing protein [Alphaproteobacteria bacterium]|jgi:S1-C subfamily serine protease|nr:trypsin-like peptidase domain-containing protein [Alphaproteobacteria bacterium]
MVGAGTATQGTGTLPWPRAWTILTVLLFLAVLALTVWVLFLRKPAVVERTVPAPPAALSAEQKARADALEQRAKALEAEIAETRAKPPAGADCPPGQRAELPTGADGAGLPLPVVAPPRGEPVKPLTSAELADRLEAATALVLTDGSVATGFFIGPETLVTNRHAVEDAKDGTVLIVSRSLASVRPGKVVTTSAPGKEGAQDFAVVRLAAGRAPGVLPLTSQAPKLSPIVAAGYPGLTLFNDAGFRRLIDGDAKAAPDLNLTQGVVQSQTTSPQGIPVLVHTASILQGNSGGPLVDACGRVTGVNTFIAVDTEQSGRVSYAQATAALVAFLARAGINPEIDARPCG